MIPINPERQTHHVRKKMTQEENDRGASPRRKNKTKEGTGSARKKKTLLHH
jgi:hypothetical protein